MTLLHSLILPEWTACRKTPPRRIRTSSRVGSSVKLRTMAVTLRIENGQAWVGSTRVAESAQVRVWDVVSDPLPDGRRIVQHERGFFVPFESGWTVEVSWGVFEARRAAAVDAPFPDEAEHASVIVSDSDGRVVVWDESNRAVGKSLDHSGHRELVPADEVLAIIDDVATWPNDHLQVIDRS
jgi:hypothetical protein